MFKKMDGLITTLEDLADVDKPPEVLKMAGGLAMTAFESASETAAKLEDIFIGSHEHESQPETPISETEVGAEIGITPEAQREPELSMPEAEPELELPAPEVKPEPEPPTPPSSPPTPDEPPTLEHEPELSTLEPEPEAPALESEPPTPELKQPTSEAESPTPEPEQPTLKPEPPTSEPEPPTLEPEPPTPEPEPPTLEPDSEAELPKPEPKPEPELSKPDEVEPEFTEIDLETPVTTALTGIGTPTNRHNGNQDAREIKPRKKSRNGFRKTSAANKAIITDNCKPKNGKKIPMESGFTAAGATIGIVKILNMLLGCCIPRPAPRPSKDFKEKSLLPKISTTTTPISLSKTSAGKLGVYKEADAEIAEIFNPVETEFRDKLLEAKPELGQSIKFLTVIGYRIQIVVGMNYFAKIKINDGPDYVEARIYKPVQGDPFLTSILADRTEEDDIEYF